MNDEIKFKSLNDLYKRLLPALRSKASELKRDGYNYIHEEDLWNFLTEVKWLSSYNLDLGSMDDDIFKITSKDLNNYVINKYKREKQGEENETL